MVKNGLNVSRVEGFHDVHDEAGKVLGIVELVFWVQFPHARLDPAEEYLDWVEKGTIRRQEQRNDAAATERTGYFGMSVDLCAIHDPN